MRWMIVFILAVLSSNATSQEISQREKADLFLTRSGVPVVLSPSLGISEVQVEKVDLPLSRAQIISDLVNAIYSLQSLSEDSAKFNIYVQHHFQPLLAKLKQQAEKRIPIQATPSQRSKLDTAATLDIKYLVSALRDGLTGTEGFPTLPDQFLNEATTRDVFGAGSLFQKVMRQQALLVD